MSTDQNLIPLTSFEELQGQHQALLLEAKGQSLGSVSTDVIKDFVGRSAATGAIILDPQQRREAQAVIRFWAAELITRGEIEWAPPSLSSPKLTTADGQAEAKSDAEESDREVARRRELLRIAGVARHWRASREKGYLLKGGALREAEQFARDDDDIQALVDASRKAELTSTRWQRSALSLIAAACLLFSLALGWALLESRRSEKEAHQAKAWAEYSAAKAYEAQDAANKDAERSAALLRQLEQTYAEQAQRGRARQQQLDEQQEDLRQIAEFARQQRNEGRIGQDDIPLALRPFVAILDQVAKPGAAESGTKPLPIVADPQLKQFLNGYDPAFLQTGLGASQSRAASVGAITIPLPKLTGAALVSAYEDGNPIDYVNFSVVLNRRWRMAVLSAVNIQRSAVVPIVRRPDRFQNDPRVPINFQLRSESFQGNDLDRGHLVNAREIAWGPAFGSDPVIAGERAYGLVNVMPNVTPQYDTFNRGLWFGLERYARETFSSQSDRVIIFSGPVVSNNDPVVDGLSVPRTFWKVLVATRPDNPASVLVEAYLVPQVGSDGTKVFAALQFEAGVYRVRLSDIERVAGLDFGETLRAADTIAASATNLANEPFAAAAEMATSLRQVVGPDRDQRRDGTQKLLNVIRDTSTSESDLRALVEAIVALASAKSFESQSAEARVNLLTLVREVPKTRWDTNRWIDIKAAARRAVADATTTLGGCSGKSQACLLIAAIKPNLDWSLAAGRTTFVQFAGMVREDVKALADKLKLLDWSIPGEERTAKAAGYNQVRYAFSEEDRRAAELLAADLRVLGRSGIRAQRASGKPKTLEIWLSI